MSRAMRIVSVVCLCLGLVSAAPVSAQTGLATMTGIVTDNSGGAVPGVTVTATNQATNVDYTGVTQRRRRLRHHQRADRRLRRARSSCTGFKSVQSNVSLSAGADRPRRLQARGRRRRGADRGRRHRRRAADRERRRRQTSCEREQVEKLPVQGRNLSTATLYTAGVTTPNPGSFNSLKNTGGGRPYVNGQREQGNNFMLDGVDMNDAIDNLIAYQPSPDAVEQVSVETNNYSPELGNVAGAIVNMVHQVGHQQRSAATASTTGATTSWRRRRGRPTAPAAASPTSTARSSAARSAGRSSKNKLFFFADYQGGRQKSPPADSFTTVIPDEWRNGDLSSLLAASTPIVVRDPQTGQPFPNNQIPVEPLQPVRAQPAGQRGALSARQRQPRA